MKSIVVYFSLDGNSELVAGFIKEALGADSLRLELERAIPRQGFAKMFHGGRQVVAHQKPALKPYQLDLAPYELVVLGGPVWAGSPVPALLSFLERSRLSDKKVALFCCHAGGKGKALEKLRDALTGNTVVAELDLVNPAKQDAQLVRAKAVAWAKTLQ
ncbi:MAG: flavodoxin [Treponema sp.]|jgi:flavodoxin|nr:flavodoxin [Treponema sp.]